MREGGLVRWFSQSIDLVITLYLCRVLSSLSLSSLSLSLSLSRSTLSTLSTFYITHLTYQSIVNRGALVWSREEFDQGVNIGRRKDGGTDAEGSLGEFLPLALIGYRLDFAHGDRMSLHR
jgi:hypothetical protein